MTGKGEYYVRCKNCGRLIKVFNLQWQGYCTNCETLFNYDTQDIVFSGITTIPSDYHYEWKKGQNLEDELSKYKRAFEILKDKLNIKTFINKGLYNENLYVVASIKDGGLITEEESKLLKELLNE